MMLKNKKTGLLTLIITCSGIIHASSAFFQAQTTTSALPASRIEMPARHVLVHDPIAREKRERSLILPKADISSAPKVAQTAASPDHIKTPSSEKPPLTNRIDSLVASKKQDSDAIFW